ncbi:MAG: penicillin-binding transpeptidase domain-containing protein [Acidobacteriota bacterium]|nr:penicillin-binding transpeptidase domain-containing protein [Pyrinomonadaceae bacterium]MDW8304037.1 penicillin-binding transpeptidase domain-containing protein [Acidobacteriota bacterium]
MLLFFISRQDFGLEKIFGGQILERVPAGLSLAYLFGLLILLMLLVTSIFRKAEKGFVFERELPREVSKKVNKAVTGRSLRLWSFIFLCFSFVIFGFHFYWVFFADANSENFQKLASRDIRFRRLLASQLRGWILDRSGKLQNALAYYKKQSDGSILRIYPLDKEMSHLLGTEVGVPGLERVLFRQENDKMPETLDILFTRKNPEPENIDVRLTIDKELQSFLARQLEGKKGAIVVLNPQTGEVLGIYSSPAFSINELKTEDDLRRFEADRANRPLLNRAMREYYVPGSTFKTFTMIAAFRAGMQDAIFTSKPEGFIPFRGSRPILDANGGCEPPYGCTDLNIAQAYEASSNQYFAQLAVALGRERLKQTAELLGIEAVEKPEDTFKIDFFPDIWNTSNPSIANAIAPIRSALVTGAKISDYDVGLEGMGQGYAGQMTPFQMALIAAAVGNLQGNLMKPKIEFAQPPQVFSRVLTAQQASQIREIMALVTEGVGGTATRVFANVRSLGIRVGGKTGTAEKLAPVFDEKGRLKTVKKKRRIKGQWIEYEAPMMYERTDSWFICIAPLENPQIAVAVVVEGGGYGAKTAAPIAANIVLKARELGLLGDKYKPEAKREKKRSR